MPLNSLQALGFIQAISEEINLASETSEVKLDSDNSFYDLIDER